MSTTRNSLPEEAEISIDMSMLKKNQYLEQTLRFNEFDGFNKEESNQIENMNERFKDKGLTIINEENILKIKYYHDPGILGAPTRDHSCREKSLFEIHNNQWCKLKINGRYTDFDTGQWFYHKTVYNIACGDDIHKDIFIGKKPDYIFEDMAKLS